MTTLRKVFIVFLALVAISQFEKHPAPLPANALSWGDIQDAFEDIVDGGNGLIENIGNFLNDLANTVASAFTSLGTAITGVAASAAAWLYSLTQESGYALVCIYTISQLATDVIDDVLDGFNSTTWDKLNDGAKYVVYNFEELVDGDNHVASYIKEYIAQGANFLSDLTETDEYMPYPFDVIDSDDFYTVVDCLDDLVLESAIEFAENVATTLVDLGTDSDLSELDLTPIFNTEDIKDELNATYECLLELGRDIKSRESDDSSNDNIIAGWLEEAYDYFEFEELVHGIEISFTACTLVCGTAAIGFAVAPESGRFAPYYVVASGVETSSVVGASIEGVWNFFPNWEAVTNTGHVVSFDAKIKIPLVPISFGTTVGLAINDSGSFGGFELRNDIIDISFGFNGAFGLGYKYSSAYWIKTLTDLGNAWDAFADVGEIAADNVRYAIQAYQILAETLGSGGYLTQTTISVDTDSSSSRRLLQNSNRMTLTCPSGELDSAGNSSSLELGWIQINEVIYGNVTGDSWCNSSTAFSTVYSECAWVANCTLDTTEDVFGNPNCSNGNGIVDYEFDVIYSCPSQGSVYDIGCYKADFWDIVNAGWIQDGNSYDFMDDDWVSRENGIAKCSKIASDKGYSGFGLYNNGMCLVGKTLLNNGQYNKYNATDCSTDANMPSNGLGSSTAMNIYIFANDDLAFEDKGCYNITYMTEYYSKIDIKSMEGDHQLTQDVYSDRRLAVSKCAQVADEANYKGFALLDGGACYVSNDFEDVEHGLEGNETDFSCGRGSGNSVSYNVYTFPYKTANNKSEDELSIWAIVGIVAGAVVVLIICIVVGVVVCRKNKQKGSSGVKLTRYQQM